MSYFDNLPKIQYEFSDGIQTIPDLFSRIAFKPSFINNQAFTYQEKQENQTRPENLSLIKYQSFDYYWILLLVNGIYDVNRDWPKMQESFGNELAKLNTKKVYYLYENADILPYDILWATDYSYGVVESWNPSYKELVIKDNYNLPADPTTMNFNIKRIIDGVPTDITNYCSNTTFTSFGVANYTEAIHEIKQGNKTLNPFSRVISGNVIIDTLNDTCSDSDKIAFQTSLLYKLVNKQSVNGVSIITKETKMIQDYSAKLNVNLIQPSVIGSLESKLNIMLNNRLDVANNIIRIG